MKDRRGVASLAWRADRTSADNERRELEALRRELEQRAHELDEQRTRLARERAEFEEDLAVLEEQRRFLDGQREKIRLEALDLETRREDAARAEALRTVTVAQRLRMESALEEDRKSRDVERERLRSEMAGVLAVLAAPAGRPSAV